MTLPSFSAANRCCEKDCKHNSHTPGRAKSLETGRKRHAPLRDCTTVMDNLYHCRDLGRLRTCQRDLNKINLLSVQKDTGRGQLIVGRNNLYSHTTSPRQKCTNCKTIVCISSWHSFPRVSGLSFIFFFCLCPES